MRKIFIATNFICIICKGLSSVVFSCGIADIYLRYADVLLMKAEAFAESNQADSARINLNKVRQRARSSFNGTPPADLLADITTSDINTLKTAIRNERRVELGQEFHRYFDLMRWGKTIAQRKSKEVSGLMWIIAAAFMIYFAVNPLKGLFGL